MCVYVNVRVCVGAGEGGLRGMYMWWWEVGAHSM